MRRYSQVLAQLRRERPHYKIVILMVTCSRETMHARAIQRGITTGRVVPPELLDQAFDAVEASVTALTPFTDFTICIENETQPRVSRYVTVSSHCDDGTGTIGKQQSGLSWPEYKELWRRDDQEGRA